MRRRPDAVPIEQIVYLDEDLHTYKYFMTGQFDAEARNAMIAQEHAEAQKNQASSAEDSIENSDNEEQKQVEPEPSHSAFYNKLKTLTDKISVFKGQFY